MPAWLYNAIFDHEHHAGSFTDVYNVDKTNQIQLATAATYSR